MSNKLAKVKRQGGASIGSGPVKYMMQDAANNPALLLKVDYENAPVPAHFYVADAFRVSECDGDVWIEFAKLLNHHGTSLRTKLEVRFPGPMFLNQLWQSSRKFQTALESYASRFGGTPASALAEDAIEPPDLKVQVVHSNNALMVFTGGECIVDFFYISPKELWIRPLRKQDIEIESVVRVIASPSLLLGLLKSCEPIVDVLKERYKGWTEVENAVESK